MKKSLYLGLTLAMLSSSALAYTNDYAGYSIKNEANLQNAAEAARFYAYTTYPQVESSKVAVNPSVHVVGYFTAEEMEKVTGEPFSTEYFNQQYENLALLGRCELDLRTVPVAMLDLANYGDIQEQNVFARLLHPVKALQAADIVTKKHTQTEEKDDFAQAEAEAAAAEEAAEELDEEENATEEDSGLEKAKALSKEEQPFEPWVRVDEIGKHKVITISQYYCQQEKMDEHILVAHTSFLSKDDKMYALTTYSYEMRTPETKKLERKYFKQSLKEKFPAPEELKSKKLESFAPKKKTELNEKFTPQLWQEHKDFVQSFKFVEPKTAVAQLSFTDPLLERSFQLPQDWFYVQVKPQDKNSQESLVLAASYPKVAALLAEEDSTQAARFLLRALGLTEGKEPLLAKLSKEDLLKLSQGLDQLLLTSSFVVEDPDLAVLLAQPEEYQTELEMSLREGMDQLHIMENGLYRIHGYGYETDFSKDKAVVDMDIHLNFLEQYEFTNWVRFACQKDRALWLSYLKKENLPANELLSEQIKNWQF